VRFTNTIDVERMSRTQRVRALFTTRLGGVSQGEFSSLNLGLHVGDRKEDVLQNRKRVAEQIGVPLEHWVAGEQVHGDHVAVIRESERGRGAFDYEEAIPASDALITREKGIVLSTYAADCVPLLLFDPLMNAIGVVHAGWKGTSSKVAKKAIQMMQQEFGSRPEDIVTAIGPSIGPCCYEVDQRVRQAILSSFIHGDRFFTENERGKWQFSLWDANISALLEAGVKRDNIEHLAMCTSCSVDQFYSYRKESGNTGRHAGLIVLV
jgi:YfiH family protein